MSESQGTCWTRETVAHLPRELLSKGSRTKPAVWRVETPEGACVVKDTADLVRPLRWVGRWLLRRERRVLRRLEGTNLAPTLLADIDRDALAMSLLPGEKLTREVFRSEPREVVERIREQLARIHAHGVYHLDLHSRSNILLGEDGSIRFVDFGASLALGRVRRWFFGRMLAWVDHQALLKHLARFAPGSLTGEEARSVLRQRRVRKLWMLSKRRPSPAASNKASRHLERLRKAP